MIEELGRLMIQWLTFSLLDLLSWSLRIDNIGVIPGNYDIPWGIVDLGSPPVSIPGVIIPNVGILVTGSIPVHPDERPPAKWLALDKNNSYVWTNVTPNRPVALYVLEHFIMLGGKDMTYALKIGGEISFNYKAVDATKFSQSGPFRGQAVKGDRNTITPANSKDEVILGIIRDYTKTKNDFGEDCFDVEVQVTSGLISFDGIIDGEFTDSPDVNVGDILYLSDTSVTDMTLDNSYSTKPPLGGFSHSIFTVVGPKVLQYIGQSRPLKQ